MKILAKLIIILVVILVLLVGGLQAVLYFGLTGILRTHVIPEVEAQAGTDIALQAARLNLLSGSVTVDGLSISNPEKFEDPSVFSLRRAHADVAVLSLLRQVAEVAGISIDDARITICRRSDGKINLSELRKAIPYAQESPEQPVAPPPDEPEPDLAQAEGMPKLLIGSLNANVLVEYVDHKQEDGPRRLALKLVLSGDDIATFPEADRQWGRVALTGHLDGDPESFVIDLKGTVAPLADPLRPSFDLGGSVASVDLALIQELTDKIDIAGDRSSLDLTIRCRNGVFDPKRSLITLRVTNARLIGKTAAKAKAEATLANLSLPLPLGGTIDAPKLDWEGALNRTLFDNLRDNPEAILKALDIDEKKINKEVDRGVKKLNKFLGEIGL